MKKIIISIYSDLLIKNIKTLFITFLISILAIGIVIGLILISFLKLILISLILILEVKLEELNISGILMWFLKVILIFLISGICIGIITKLLIMI